MVKFKALALFLIVLLFAVSCKEVPASIKLKIEFENKLNQDLSNIYGIQVYKDGKIFKKFSSFEKPYIRKEITLDSLTKGTYKFVYENLVNQTLQKTIEVKDNKIYNISIYPNYSNYRDLISKSFIINLGENQKVEFYFESLGCFHSAKESVIITKKGKVYYAEIKGQSKKLSKEQLEALIKMECELEFIKYGSCTTSDHYVVKAGKKEKEFYDESCTWNGWKNMSKKLN